MTIKELVEAGGPISYHGDWAHLTRPVNAKEKSSGRAVQITAFGARNTGPETEVDEVWIYGHTHHSHAVNYELIEA